MTVKSHVLLTFVPLGLALSEHMIPLNNIELIIDAVIGTFIGAILPDIDEPNSYIGRRLRFVSKSLRFFKIKHRTYTHSLFFPLLILFLGKISPLFYFISFGVFMHILEDFLTNGGVPLFYPFIKQRFSAGMFITGGRGEYIFTFFVIFSVLIYLSFKVIYGL